MPEARDETDGTPEWAKRFFERFRRFRGYAALVMFFVGLPIYGGYQLWNAAVAHRIWATHAGPSRWITFDSDPVRFSLDVAFSSLATFVPVIVLSIARRKPILMERLKALLEIRG